MTLIFTKEQLNNINCIIFNHFNYDIFKYLIIMLKSMQ